MGFIFGTLLLIAGLYLFIFVDRRQFYKKNSMGIEEYDSYGEAITSRFINTISGIAGAVLILVGIIILVISASKSGMLSSHNQNPSDEENQNVKIYSSQMFEIRQKNKLASLKLINDIAKTKLLQDFEQYSKIYENSEFKGIEENQLQDGIKGNMPFFEKIKLSNSIDESKNALNGGNKSDNKNSNNQHLDKDTTYYISAIKINLSDQQQELLKKYISVENDIKSFTIRVAAVNFNYLFAGSSKNTGARFSTNDDQYIKNLRDQNSKLYEMISVEKIIILADKKKLLLSDNNDVEEI